MTGASALIEMILLKFNLWHGKSPLLDFSACL
jgi:hypothetical protein